MYELIILSKLMRSPGHGYLIAKIINDMIGPYAKLSNGRFYPLLAKLVEEGYIVEVDEETEVNRGQRPSRRYAITDKGRERFHRLMLDTTSNPGEYQKIFLHKASSLHILEPDERMYLIGHYMNYCMAHLLHLRAETEDMRQNGDSYQMSRTDQANTIDAMEQMQRQWQVEFDWAKSLHDRELAEQEQNGSSNQSSKLKIV